MASVLQIQGDESVLLRVTHSNLKSFSADLSFSLQVNPPTNQTKLVFFWVSHILSALLLLDDSGIRERKALEKMWDFCEFNVPWALWRYEHQGFGFDRRFKAARFLFSAWWVSPIHLPYLFFFLLFFFSVASLMNAAERHAVLVANRKFVQYTTVYVSVGFRAFWLLQSTS